MPTVKKIRSTSSVQAKKVAVKKVVATKKAVVKAAATKETGLKQSVYDVKGKVAESINLPAEIFGVKINKTLMTQAVRVYLANQRRGTLSTKSRGEVKISTRKIYRQKGTGRARHGAKSAPIFVGGGIAFGPKPRDFSLKLNQNMKRVALFSALTSKLKDGEIKIITGLEKIEPKTKKMVDVIDKLELNGKNAQVLLIMPSGNQFANIVKAGRNIKGITVTSANLINTYEVLVNKRILFMKSSIDSLKETFLK
jgi:large subunit ribosomal protein L4